jgi:uncharacterized membrane protein
MTANVAMVIIPNQKIVVADLRAGRTPDPEYGRIAKLRSTHNNYLTLPVIFLMLSNHYPLAFGNEHAWIIAALVFLMGVTIRHFFNSMHARRGRPWWTWAATAAVFAAIVGLSIAPAWRTGGAEDVASAVRERHLRAVAAPEYSEVRDIVLGRCSMCHAEQPNWPGLAAAPGGVALVTDAQIAAHARQIYLQAGVSHAMPPANLSWMEPAERALIVDWYTGLRAGPGIGTARQAALSE